ncbi:MAG TPA: hypothetical protein VGQ39_22405 [Pyrinomonadaceae bacterium]|jgi:photosystem II stability/assembly factor-like uncharacterized protein|nr:hypothetical protein [Pyrinomonadaceae bacterium]
MATKKLNESVKPVIDIEPFITSQKLRFLVRGSGWSGFPLLIQIDKQPVRIQRILLGLPIEGGFRPSPTGEFLLEMSTRDLEPGRHVVHVGPLCNPRGPSASKELQVMPLPGRSVGLRSESADARLRRQIKEDGGGGALMRRLDWFKRRFGHLDYIPDGVRVAQVDSVRKLRDRRDRGTKPPGGEPGQPVPGVCNWTPAGPGPVIVSPTTAFSGRAISIAFDPVNNDTIYAGAANGGVWKSTDRGRTWSPKSDFQNSMAIGTIAIDPNNTLRIFAGTGQYGEAVGTLYGNGVLYSANGGDTWSELATSTFQRDEISKILFDTTDATSQIMFLSSRQGVYESTDGGVNWTLLRAGDASDLVMIETGPGVQLIAGFAGSGIFTATRTGMGWSSWTQFVSGDFPTTFQRIVLGQCRDHPNRIYAAFSDGYNVAGIVKTQNGGNSWTRLTPPLVTDINSQSTTSGATPHVHNVTVSDAQMLANTLVYTSGPASAGPAHTHTLTLTAQQLSDLRDGFATVVVTSSTAAGHTHAFVLNRRLSGQTWYNFHISPHPTNSDIVYYGEVRLWKTSTGNAPWTQLPILHTDNHAFAFAPDDANQIWSIGDGGVYMSPDAGASFQHRNRDLQTLEYISVALHPQWETIMIGGTQDNGTHRYTGQPAWEFSDGGDGGFTAINPSLPTRMYHEYVSTTFYRSDSSGAIGTWALKNSGVTGGAEFYAPFVLDPSNPSVCYFGGGELWRSDNNADAWSAITSVVAGNITAIAVHPMDSNTIYVGTTTGRVYLVQKTGATWALADVTTTEITGADLPAGVYISDLAVDPAGNVWITLSSVLWSETTGEFSNDHVYRRPAGGGNWTSRSTGLAQANPVNSIIIDPADSNRLFCGCDLGVFRTDNAGMNWVPWDQGLPNVTVFDLQIHSPRRLLRAATHGRSIWERHIDAASCPLVDLYMRDNILDSGRVQPTPEAAHPFTGSWAGHWQSEDIKVDGPEPNFQTTNPIDNYVDFASLQHRTARRNQTNRFYVQVHNRGVNIAHSVQVRAFFAPTSPGLPPLPADFWTGGRPFSGTPSGPNWTPVGSTINLGDLEPGEPGVAEWDWVVPNSAPQHSCLLAVATCTEDPITGVGTLNPDQLVLNSKHVTLKNLNVQDAVAGTASPPEQAMQVELHATSREDRLAFLRFQWGTLPKKSRVLLTFAPGPNKRPVIDASPEEWKRLGIEVSDKYAKVFPETTTDACGREIGYDRKRVLLVNAGDREYSDLPGIRLTFGVPVRMAMNLITTKDAKGTYHFDLVRVSGKQIIGGVTYQIRMKDSW